jgi:hypothetical protein
MNKTFICSFYGFLLKSKGLFLLVFMSVDVIGGWSKSIVRG